MFKLVVLSCLVAAAAASGLFYGAPLAYSTPLVYNSPLLAPYNYRGPLSLAPGQPANILAADGRPLDTLDVNIDRAAHYTAKALDSSAHLLKKRSVALAYNAPFAYTAAPLAYTAYSAPFAYSTPLIKPYNYRGPLSLAPGQPANILGSDGRPLDTLDVNTDRAAHYTAKALESPVHLLKKRSVAVVPVPLVARAPLAYTAPLAYPAYARYGYSYATPYTYSYAAATPFAHALY